MKSLRYILSVTFACLVCFAANAQVDRREVRQGNRQFRKEEWKQADISYRKALVKDSTSFAANYNIASNLYRQENFEEAGKYLDKTLEQAPMNKRGEDAFFNSGDVAIAKKDWKTAVDVLKKAILMDPTDLEAKENYAYAKKMLENQGDGGGGGNDQNQDNQDQNQNQDQNNQDNQNDQNQDQNNQDNQDQNQDQNQGQQQEQPAGISPQQAQQILKAIQAKEKETQDKVNKEKAEVLKSKQKEKNW